MITRSYSSNISKKQIFLLSIPVFFSNLAIPLVGMVDIALMGNLGETKYLAALSIAVSVMTMVIWSFGFLRMGTVGLVAQLYGKGDYREISRTLIRNFLFAFVIAVIIIIFKPKIIDLISFFFPTSIETQKLINTYISFRIFSVPAELILYILIGFYLGIQKTKISSLITIVLSSLNIIFSSFLVLSLNMNILGVSLGTFLSSNITVVIFLFFTYRFIVKKFQIKPNVNGVIIYSKFLKLFKLNLDIFIRTLLLTFSFIWITFLGAKFGEDILSVNTILLQFILFSSFFLDAYAYSTEGIVGFTIGRKNKKSFLKVVMNSFQISFITAIIISVVYLIFFKYFINILTDIEILRFLSFKFFMWIVLIVPIASICYQLDGIFVGASQTKEMRDSMIISVIIYILISIYSIKYFENHGVWFSLLIFMMLRSITLSYFFGKILKKF